MVKLNRLSATHISMTMMSWVFDLLIAPYCLFVCLSTWKYFGGQDIFRQDIFPYQNKTTEHHNEQNKPFCVFVLYKASDAASKLEPREVLFCGCRKSAALR